MRLWAGMRYAVVLATAPAAEPLTYAQAKAYMRLLDDTDQTTIVEPLIRAARAKVETDTGRRLITQSWDLLFDAFPRDAIRPPFVPLQSVTSIKTTSAAGVESTLAAATYVVDAASTPGRIVLADGGSWPTDLRTVNAIAIRCACGYGTAGTAVPDPILQAMLQLVTHWYRHRDAAVYPPLPSWFGYDALLAPYRRLELA
jgi:uncharacterized phiE125 gp8 family phage protein